MVLVFLTSFSHIGYYLNVFLWLWKIGPLLHCNGVRYPLLVALGGSSQKAIPAAFQIHLPLHPIIQFIVLQNPSLKIPKANLQLLDKRDYW